MFFGLFGKKAKGNEVLIGEVVHYFDKVKAAVIKVDNEKISVGDNIRIKGHSVEFDQTVKSMQVDHKPVESVSKGGEAAIEVKKKARTGSKVYLVR